MPFRTHRLTDPTYFTSGKLNYSPIDVIVNAEIAINPRREECSYDNLEGSGANYSIIKALILLAR